MKIGLISLGIYKVYQHLEKLLLNAVRKLDFEDSLAAVIDFYGNDFDATQLHLHLQTLSANIPEDFQSSTCTIMDIF